MSGNSLGVPIPRGLAEQIGLAASTEVRLCAKAGEWVVKPTRFRLASACRILVATVMDENRRASLDTGEAVGLEISRCSLPAA